MPLYESTFIARQDISTADVEKIAEAMEAVVKDGGGKMVKREYWGLRSLSYRINKSRKGHYVMLGIDAPAPAVKELDRKMSIHEDIIRRMTIRVEKISDEPSAIMQSGKDSKGRRDGEDFFE